MLRLMTMVNSMQSHREKQTSSEWKVERWSALAAPPSPSLVIEPVSSKSPLKCFSTSESLSKMV